MSQIKPVFFGNWKMNHLYKDGADFFEKFADLLPSSASEAAHIGIAAPYVFLGRYSSVLPKGVRLGAQNAHWEESGAHTGEISVPMLKNCGVDFAILGHSERREMYGETDEAVSKRAAAVIKGGLTAVVCVGETKEQFEAKRTKSVVKAQLDGSLADLTEKDTSRLVIAYEPVWAIGTGLAATPEIASDVHDFIRDDLHEKFGSAGDSVAIIYGGSTKPENIAELMAKPNINGALTGGASLKADVFSKLIENALG